MIPSILPVGPVPGGLPPVSPAGLGNGPARQGGFAELVSGFVERTNADQLNSSQAVHELATGKTDNVQDVVMAVANAEMSFQFFMELRNRIIDSWNELMRMQF